MKYIITLGLFGTLVLSYLLSRFSDNTQLFSENYTILLGLNVLLAVILTGVILYQIVRLRRRIREGVFGSRLMVKLILVFGLMAVVPGALVYAVSVQFIKQSIETWFDVRVDRALESGIRLGRNALTQFSKDLIRKGDLLAIELADRENTKQEFSVINEFREQNGIYEITLFNAKGNVITTSSNSFTTLMPNFPDKGIIRQVRQQKSFTSLEQLGDKKTLYFRAVFPVNILRNRDDIRILQILQPVPQHLAEDVQLLEQGFKDYQQISIGRSGLKEFYSLTLTLCLLLALLCAIVVAFMLSTRLSRPLGALAQGTKAVAQGDFTPVYSTEAKDELRILMESFNEMASQLLEARNSAEKHQFRIEMTKNYLQSILANLSSGVLAFDNHLQLKEFNQSAGRILNIDFHELFLNNPHLMNWEEVSEEFGTFSTKILDLFNIEQNEFIQKQIEVKIHGISKLLLIKGTRLPQDSDHGYVIVFDDVTDLIQAQRDSAWGEVARRLAHEIKNPLTPIQLSAERLQFKLMPNVNEQDGEILKRATTTIVNQVTALKSMVTAFSEYARSPKLKLQSIELNQLIQDILGLYETQSNVITALLMPEIPLIYGDQTLLRQVIHNLLQNAQDALSNSETPKISIQTRLNLMNIGATTNRLHHGMICYDHIEFIIEDNGTGFPEELLTRAFEPYITTKSKGTGLGLAIVKKIIDEHKGLIQVENAKPHGAIIRVFLPIYLEQYYLS